MPATRTNDRAKVEFNCRLASVASGMVRVKPVMSGCSGKQHDVLEFVHISFSSMFACSKNFICKNNRSDYRKT